MKYYIIQQRAETLYEFLDEKFASGEIERIAQHLHAFKASFLLKSKSISKYIDAFEHAGTYFCIKEADLIYEEYADLIPGHQGLTEEEKSLLFEGRKLIEDTAPFNLVSL